MTDMPTILTFRPMIDSEGARLVLAHHDIAFDESDHVFGWVSLLTVLKGGSTALPMVYGGGIKTSGLRPLIDLLDGKAKPERRLIPPDPALHDMVEADWNSFNVQMGAAVAVVAYYHLLPERDVMAEEFARPLPPIEKWLTPICYPLLRGVFNSGLKLTPERATTSLDEVRKGCDALAQRIADGRRYLCGDRFTLGDLSVMGSLAPLVQPFGFHAPTPRIDRAPEALQAVMREIRAHPVGDFVTRLYAEHGAPEPAHR